MALITKKEAGERLGRSARTIDEWVQHGILRAHTVKQTQFIDSATVDALLDTEADIRHAEEERGRVLDEIKRELEELRQRERFSSEPVRQVILDLMQTLGVNCDREQMVITEVLNGSKYDDIGDRLMLTRERVRQILFKGLRRLAAGVKSYRQMLGEQVELRGEADTLRRLVKEKDRQLTLLRKQLNVPEPERESVEEQDERARLMNKRLVDMDLSVRTLNCLKSADIDTLGKLTRLRKTELLKFRNFGKRSLSELDDLLDRLGLTYGTGVLREVRDKHGWHSGFEIVDEQEAE